MGDSLYPDAGSPMRVTDNGDGHYRVTVAAEPGLVIYPSFAEWKALEELIRGTGPASPGYRFTVVQNAEVA